MTVTRSRRGEVEKRKRNIVALDTEGQQPTQDSYRDALQRASRKVTESGQNNATMESRRSSGDRTAQADLGVVGGIKVKVVVNNSLTAWTDRCRRIKSTQEALESIL